MSTNPAPSPLPPLDDPNLAVPRPRARLGRRLFGLIVLLALLGAAGAFAVDYWRRVRPHLGAVAALGVQGVLVNWHNERGGYTSVDFSKGRGLLSGGTGDSLRHLRDLWHLRELILTNDYALQDKDLAQVSGLTELEELRLGRARPEYGQRYTDVGLAHLRGLSRLKVLDVRGSEITDEGLAVLANFPRLEELDLSQTDVTDAGLAHLKSVPRLRVLYLDVDAITDAGLARLAVLPDLEELHLDGTLITDVGLSHLKGLSRLKLLDATRTRVTGAGVVELGGANPDLEIVTDEPERYR